MGFMLLSGRQDSNLRLSGPKPDVLLRDCYDEKVEVLFEVLSGSNMAAIAIIYELAPHTTALHILWASTLFRGVDE